MEILFCIALPSELKIIKQEMKDLVLKGIKIDFLLTGVGVLNTSYAIKKYIDEKKKPDFIINIGVCGKKSDIYNDFFQVYRIKNLSHNKEVICPSYIDIFPLKSIACSDKIITNGDELSEENFVDMESFGIDFICDKEKIPYVIIKKSFDFVSKDSKKVSIKDLENVLKGFDGEYVINKIKDFGEKNKKNTLLEEKILSLKEKFQLTFSETEFLKKYAHKKIAFQYDIMEVFTELSFLEKKEVLKHIKE